MSLKSVKHIILFFLCCTLLIHCERNKVIKNKNLDLHIIPHDIYTLIVENEDSYDYRDNMDELRCLLSSAYAIKNNKKANCEVSKEYLKSAWQQDIKHILMNEYKTMDNYYGYFYQKDNSEEAVLDHYGHTGGDALMGSSLTKVNINKSSPFWFVNYVFIPKTSNSIYLAVTNKNKESWKQYALSEQDLMSIHQYKILVLPAGY